MCRKKFCAQKNIINVQKKHLAASGEARYICSMKQRGRPKRKYETVRIMVTIPKDIEERVLKYIEEEKRKHDEQFKEID